MKPITIITKQKCISVSSDLSPANLRILDQRANGYARGEGIGTLIIKRLEDALRDGDTIRSIIRNTASNQDGRTPGITQPSREAQVKLIKQTFDRAGIDLEPTRFFEAHGTGTPIGDPIEVNAIGHVFRDYRSPCDPLFIGAVKANFGHLEGSSGLAGLIKAVLVLEKGIIPPIADFETLNGGIDSEALNLRVSTLMARNIAKNFPKQNIIIPWY